MHKEIFSYVILNSCSDDMNVFQEEKKETSLKTWNERRGFTQLANYMLKGLL